MKKNYKNKQKFCLAILFLLTITVVKAQWSNGQNATYVIGQTNFTNTGMATTDSTFSSPVVQGGAAIDSKHGVMYVTDFFANRVLRFAYPLTANSPNANLVFGQPNFTSSTANNGGLSASSMNYPASCTIDTVTGTLWIVDNGNHRILRFDSAYSLTTNQPAANEVLGQPNFASNNPGLSATQININNSPITGNLAHYDQLNDFLWVVDNGNNRVLRFDSPKTIGNGAPANHVLGQLIFTTNGLGTSQNQFSRPDGVTTIGNYLFVSDANNDRILRFDNVSAIADGGNASGVIGQSLFTTNGTGTTQSQLALPSGLTSDCSGSLYIADLNNNRILIFYNASSLANGPNADAVLLKNNFTSSSPSGPSQNAGGTCSTLAFDNKLGNLIALDRTNSRYLVFNTCLAGSFNSQPVNTTACSGNAVSLSFMACGTGISLQWQVDPGSGFVNLSNVAPYSGANSATLTINPATTLMNGYTYRCVMTGPCTTTQNTSNAILTVNLCTGIIDPSQTKISVFPNPSEGIFSLKNFPQGSSIEIFNMLGEKIYAADINGTDAEINLEKFDAGIFLYRVNVEGRVIQTGRLVKTN